MDCARMCQNKPQNTDGKNTLFEEGYYRVADELEEDYELLTVIITDWEKKQKKRNI